MTPMIVFWVSLLIILFFLISSLLRSISAVFYSVVSSGLLAGGIALILIVVILVFNIIYMLVTNFWDAILGIVVIAFVIGILAAILGGVAAILAGIASVVVTIVFYLFAGLDFIIVKVADLCENLYRYFLSILMKRLQLTEE